MTFVRNHPRLSVLALIALAVVLVIGGYATYLAGEAGALPWQEEPTRIAITPFAGIPDFGGAAPAGATGTPAP